MTTKLNQKPEVVYRIECLPEDSALDGALSSGDDAADAALVAELRARLAQGDDWAWCIVKVTATLKVGKWFFVGTDYLSACSYKGEADFAGLLPAMRQEALADLRRNLAATAEEGKAAEEVLRGWA